MLRIVLSGLCVTSLVFLATGCGEAERTPPASETPGATEEPAADAKLGTCCVSSVELFQQMPGCCREGLKVPGKRTGCCEQGMLDTTADADRPECCKQGKALLDQMSPCCKDAIATGEVGACCKALPAALLKAATKQLKSDVVAGNPAGSRCPHAKVTRSSDCRASLQLTASARRRGRLASGALQV